MKIKCIYEGFGYCYYHRHDYNASIRRVLSITVLRFSPGIALVKSDFMPQIPTDRS